MLSRKLPSSPWLCPYLVIWSSSRGLLHKKRHSVLDSPAALSGKPLECGFSGLGSVPYGQCWQNLRRFSAIEIFSAARIAALASIRTEEIRLIVKELMEEGGSKKVNLARRQSKLRTIGFMVSLVDPEKLGEGELENIRGIFSPTLEATVCDYFPWLRWLSFHGLEKRFLRIHKRRDEFMQRMTENHRKKFPSSPSRRDEDECQSDKGGFVHKMGTT
ncbi:cytochrome P450 81C13-like [Punica granatum]|uniref:Cytochrome P450 81C13-like n=1 Tax=Punica granatum TaxID=22663 RepID=A0A6P8DG89_PUNGR|nr:cytochrome P450 81C13-like [Punica granatum]